MKVEGLKGCYEKTGPLFYFARMMFGVEGSRNGGMHVCMRVD